MQAEGPGETGETGEDLDTMDDIQLLLEDVCDNVEDARDTLGRAHGLLASDDAQLLTEHIETALTRIDNVLAALGDAGQAEFEAALPSIDGLADECVSIAKRALASHETGSATPDRIGGAMKTLRQMISEPGGLRTRAGL